MQVSRPVATSLNTLNILAPVLLLAALVVAVIARFGDYPQSINHLLMQDAALLVVLAIFIRIIWGVCIHIIKKKHAKK